MTIAVANGSRSEQSLTMQADARCLISGINFFHLLNSQAMILSRAWVACTCLQIYTYIYICLCTVRCSSSRHFQIQTGQTVFCSSFVCVRSNCQFLPQFSLNRTIYCIRPDGVGLNLKTKNNQSKSACAPVYVLRICRSIDVCSRTHAF